MPLRLKSLELQGYKTFASRTVFEFAEGITAIVGPNGSGKSNIADALRWVLGEQSYGLLRAKKTEDMIFAGSESRTRAGMAGASILFDNTENWLPLDFSEVGMGRRAYRDGRNDYLLNGQHVRLREINEVLAQSGLSERTYTILGQGLVDASLALKADERRRLFEEAAGVGLYRTRREETLRRLATTQRNLERILDIMTELEPRLRTLKRQARRAQQFTDVQEDLRVLLREWYGYHWHKAQNELAESRDILHQQEERQREARQAYQKAQSDHSGFRERLQELRSQLNSWHRESSDHHDQRESVTRQLAVLEERQRALAVTKQSLDTDHDRTVEEQRLSQEQLNQVEQEVDRLKSEADEARRHLTTAQAALESRQAEREGVEKELQAAQSTATSLNTRQAEIQARLDELDIRQKSQSQQVSEIEKAIQQAKDEVSRVENAYDTAQSAREKAEDAHHQAEEHLQNRKKELVRIEAEKNKISNELSERNAQKSRQAAKLDVLDQAEQALTGYAEGTRYLLDLARQSRLKGAHGALSTCLNVPPEIEKAVAAVLGEHLDAILLEHEQLEDALDLLDAEEAGRAILFPIIGTTSGEIIQAPSDSDCLGVAAELVEAPPELHAAVEVFLGQVLVVKDRSAAQRLIAGQASPVQVVTLNGEVFRGDGLVVAGKSTHGSTLSRSRQRRELEGSLKSLDQQLSDFNEKYQSINKDLEAVQKETTRAEAAVEESRKRLERAQSVEQQSFAELESAQRQLAWQEKQLELTRTEAARAETDVKALNDSRSEIESQSAQVEEEIRSWRQQLAGLTVDEPQEQVAYWSTRVAVAEQAYEDALARKQERQNMLERLQEQQDEFAQRLKDLKAQGAQLETERAALQEQENTISSQIADLRAKIDPAEKDLSEAEKQEREMQDQEGAAQRSMTSADRLYNQVQVDVIRRQEALDSLQNRIQDDFGLVMFEYASDVSGPMPLPLDGMVQQLPAVAEISDDLEDQVTRQRSQLRRMGPINPEAQQEYESESERYEFMQTQVEDLKKAETDLRQVIAELDELTKQEFVKTFEAVDKEFRQIFVRLFGGGSARLTLTDPDNLVDTGIDIEARLPGRREQGLALLSGGERSLTAIALVFALLKVSPTPICVMDEVDAMLDEANVGRFRDLLQELSKETQFIIITHNRNTVQAADVIYGVTMGRDSASQIISLRLDEVTDEYVG